jgi:protein-tyrosine phosphatase
MKCLECADDRLHGAVCEICYGGGVARYIPIPADPWNEITPRLYQGSALHKVDEEFDSVYTLCSVMNGPAYGVQHRHLRIVDGELSVDQFRQVVDLAKFVAEDLEAGKRVLVRCRAGLNRSGLVVALALAQQGMTADEILSLVREKRSPWALCNRSFVEYIRLVAA